MPRDVRDLISSSIDAIKLNVLVFGPAVDPLSTDERTRNLQLKRIQIRDELAARGHNPKYAEELVDPSLGNMLMQEELIMREYDVIVTLVGSPGTITEAAFIARNPQLAQKSQLFMDAGHTNGLVAEGCRLAAQHGAYFKEYEYPRDLVDCNLLGFVMVRISAAQQIKYFS
jgi:hypothetical protein